MSRREFTRETKRKAWDRADGRCEAVGEWYGLPQGERCGNDLDHGIEYDHIDLDANSKDNSLSNCAAVCIPCHRYKTRTRDIPVAAKTQRQQDKHRGIKRTSRPMPGSKASGWKKPFHGPAVRREGEKA